MSPFRGFLPGMIVGLGIGLVAVIICIKIDKDAADLAGAGRVNGAGRADPSPGPPVPWPAYDGGPMHPGEHLYQLITSDDKGVHARTMEFLPKLLTHDSGAPESFPPPTQKPPPAFP